MMEEEKEHEIDQEKTQYYNRMYEHVKGLINTEQGLGKEYTKSLIALSGGALGLTITLVSGAFGTILSKAYLYLYCSWLLFGMCIVVVLFSIKAGQLSFRKEVKLIYAELAKGSDASGSAYEGWWVKFSEIGEICGGFLFIIGVLLVCIFVLENT